MFFEPKYSEIIYDNNKYWATISHPKFQKVVAFDQRVDAEKAIRFGEKLIEALTTTWPEEKERPALKLIIGGR